MQCFSDLIFLYSLEESEISYFFLKCLVGGNVKLSGHGVFYLRFHVLFIPQGECI